MCWLKIKAVIRWVSFPDLCQSSDNISQMLIKHSWNHATVFSMSDVMQQKKKFSHQVVERSRAVDFFYILADSFQFQLLHPLSLSLIEGNVGVLWELFWKGNPLVRGSSHARGISGRWESTVTQRNQAFETSEWPAQFLMNYAVKLWCPREPVPNDKHIMCPPVCKI